MNKYSNLLITLGLLLFCLINHYFIHKEYLKLYELQNELVNSYKKIAVLMMKDSKNWYSEENKHLYFESVKNKTEEEIEEKLYSDFLNAKYEKN